MASGRKYFCPENNVIYLNHIKENIENKPVTRKICYILDIKCKSARRRMKKYAFEYMADYDSLSYWNGDVPKEVVHALGSGIIEISKYLGEGGSLTKLYKVKTNNISIPIHDLVRKAKIK